MPIVKKLLGHNEQQLVYNLSERLKADKKASKNLDAYRDLVATEAKAINAVNFFAKDINKQEVVSYAASRKESEIMEHLLSVHQDRGSRLDFLLEIDRNYMTPLQHCIQHGACSSVLQLLELRKSRPDQASGNKGENV